MTQIPIIGLFATVICVAAIIVGMYSVSQGIHLSIKFYQYMGAIASETAYLDNYRLGYMLLAIWTLVVVVATLFADFMMTSDPHPLGKYFTCTGTRMCLLVSAYQSNAFTFNCNVRFKLYR